MHPELFIRKRMLLLTLALTLLFGAVCVRVGSLAVFQAEELTARGVSQWTRKGVVMAQRGAIVDSVGETIALSATAYIVSANPQLVSDERAFAALLAPLLDTDEAAMAQKLANKAYASVTLKRQVSRDVVDAIRALRAQSDEAGALLRGIRFDEDTRRVYPKGAFLAQALGLTNVDSQGQSGLEQQYETLLAGVPGSLVTEVDARARTLPDGKTAYIPPQAGATLKLTVDNSIQGFVEKAMRECLAVNNAKSVSCVMMDVNTGGILALCMKPDYDPNDPPRDDLETLQQLMRITLISDVYEPGSTFKMLTAAAALDSGATTPEEGFHCSGTIKVDGDTIRCWKNAHGAQTMREGFYNSCNPVFVQLGLRLGTDTFYRYLRAFGLGHATGIDLPGEGSGILISASRVKNVDLARIGFGQSVALTPLQLITAASAVVNGGRLMKPYIVQEVLDENGEALSRTQPQVVATPIREETSALMRELLEGVVREGGGRNAYIEGYRVGGKTGTAQVYKEGKIVSNVHIGSFLGFAPADNPRFAILVIVNEAQVPVDYGGTTAAPFARQVILETLQYLGVSPETPGATAQPLVTLPDVAGMPLAEARKTLGALGLRVVTDEQSEQVVAQTPAAGAQLPAGGQVMLYTYQSEPVVPDTLVRVPDVRGLSIVEAARTLRARGLAMTLSGSGLAVSQKPAADTYAMPGTAVEVSFQAP